MTHTHTSQDGNVMPVDSDRRGASVAVLQSCVRVPRPTRPLNHSALTLCTTSWRDDDKLRGSRRGCPAQRCRSPPWRSPVGQLGGSLGLARESRGKVAALPPRARRRDMGPLTCVAWPVDEACSPITQVPHKGLRSRMTCARANSAEGQERNMQRPSTEQNGNRVSSGTLRPHPCT